MNTAAMRPSVNADAENMDDPGPRYQGTLEKQGKLSTWTWKKYWFILKNVELSYVKDQNKTSSPGHIDLSHAQSVRAVNLNHGFPFEIVTRSRTHNLSASSAEQRDRWVKVILDAMAWKGRSKSRSSSQGSMVFDRPFSCKSIDEEDDLRDSVSGSPRLSSGYNSRASDDPRPASRDSDIMHTDPDQPGRNSTTAADNFTRNSGKSFISENLTLYEEVDQRSTELQSPRSTTSNSVRDSVQSDDSRDYEEIREVTLNLPIAHIVEGYIDVERNKGTLVTTTATDADSGQEEDDYDEVFMQSMSDKRTSDNRTLQNGTPSSPTSNSQTASQNRTSNSQTSQNRTPSSPLSPSRTSSSQTSQSRTSNSQTPQNQPNSQTSLNRMSESRASDTSETSGSRKSEVVMRRSINRASLSSAAESPAPQSPAPQSPAPESPRKPGLPPNKPTLIKPALPVKPSRSSNPPLSPKPVGSPNQPIPGSPRSPAVSPTKPSPMPRVLPNQNRPTPSVRPVTSPVQPSLGPKPTAPLRRISAGNNPQSPPSGNPQQTTRIPSDVTAYFKFPAIETLPNPRQELTWAGPVDEIRNFLANNRGPNECFPSKKNDSQGQGIAQLKSFLAVHSD